MPRRPEVKLEDRLTRAEDLEGLLATDYLADPYDPTKFDVGRWRRGTGTRRSWIRDSYKDAFKNPGGSPG